MSLLSRIARAWGGGSAAQMQASPAPAGPGPAGEPSVADAAAGADAALPAGDLLARLRAHALGPAPPGRVASDPGHRDVRMRAAAVLARIDAQPERIPRRPQLLPALMRATGGGDASVRAIAELVQQDPTLTGNVLRVANSAAYRVPGRPLESVERAIARLGTDGMRRIVAATLLQPVSDGHRGAFAGFAPVSWAHSLATAEAAAQYVARVDRERAATAHLAALVHGLGGIVVVQAVRDEYAHRPLLVPDAAVPAALLDSAGATAARIAEAWELPAAVIAALAPAPADEAGPLPRALWIGRLAAAAVVLVRAGELDAAAAFATMARLDDAGADIVRRLLEQGDDAIG